MPSYGIIVEGEGDSEVFQRLIKRVNSPDAHIYPLVCGGVGGLMSEFPKLLRTLEHLHNGGPVDGALVIRDADNRPVQDVWNRMKEILGNRTYHFPHGLELCVVRRNMDAWLLADENAINTVRSSRHPTRGRDIARVNDAIEDIPNSKDRLRQLLTQAGLIYTPAVLGEIAAAIDVERLEGRVPSFRAFRESVLRIYR